MSGRLFVPQTQLDTWLEDGLVDVTVDGLAISGEGRILPLEPAFRFLSLLDGEDAAGLLSRVKSEGELRGLGAEPYGDSVLLGEVAYEVVPGFLATYVGPAPGNAQRQSAVAVTGATPIEARPGPKSDREGGDAELLSAFFLGKVK